METDGTGRDDPLMDKLVDYVRELPEDHKLASERTLEQEWGVSRPALRTRLRTLEAAGIVERRGRAGSFRRMMQPEDVATIMRIGMAGLDLSTEAAFRPVRRALEREAAGLAAIARPEAALARMADDLAAFRDLPSSPERAVIDADFHAALFEASGEPALQFMHAASSALIEESVAYRSERLSRIHDGLAESYELHAAILDAVRSGDPRAAMDAVERLIAQDIDV